MIQKPAFTFGPMLGGECHGAAARVPFAENRFKGFSEPTQKTTLNQHSRTAIRNGMGAAGCLGATANLCPVRHKRPV